MDKLILSYSKTKILLLSLLVVVLSSCAAPKKMAYLQDAMLDIEVPKEPGAKITIRPADMISISVSSKDTELSLLFNLPRVEQVIGSESGLSQRGDLLGYTVNSKGYINFPILGPIYIKGLTKEGVQDLIQDALVSQDLLKDAIVIVDFLNLTFSVMGEVARPGQYNITKEQTTIFNALSMAGDLTIFGIRDKVFLTRDNENTRITYKLNLSTDSIYNSPAFYVQQNDMIYVEPNKVKSNQSTVNGNNVRSTSFWMSLVSLLTTVSVLIVK